MAIPVSFSTDGSRLKANLRNI
jgi:hypothetical protein